MKILFDAHGCPPGNNGGSATIIRSANTLVDLGHNVTIISNAPNQHEWNELRARYKICHDLTKVPKADAVIATGFLSAKHVARLPDKNGDKFHWIRGWETWIIGDLLEIKRTVLELPTKKIVNSGQLFKKLQALGYPSTIVRPGYDFDLLYPMNLRQNNRKILHRPKIR